MMPTTGAVTEIYEDETLSKKSNETMDSVRKTVGYPTMEDLLRSKPLESKEKDTKKYNNTLNRYNLQENVLGSFYETNCIDIIVREIKIQGDVYKKTLSPEEIGVIARGHIFENLARASIMELHKDEIVYPELGDLLLRILKNPTGFLDDFNARISNVDITSLSPEDLVMLEKFKRSYPGLRAKFDRPLQNNDLVAINMIKEEDTGKTVAVVTGSYEMKNYDVLQKGDSSASKIKQQLLNAAEGMYNVVQMFKGFFPLYKKVAGLGEDMPTDIDCRHYNELTQTIVMPQGINYTDDQKRMYFRGYEFENRVPFNKAELEVLYTLIVPQVVAAVEKSKN